MKRENGADIPAECLPWASVEEDVVNAVEVGEVCVYLDNPVWLHQDHGPNKDEADPAGEKWFDLHPRNDIVEGPRDVEWDCGHRQPPGIDGRVE